DREKNFPRDRHRLLEQERRVGIAERGGDAAPRLAELVETAEPVHEPALAAAAFQHLRLDEVSRPLLRLAGHLLARAQQHAARQGDAVPAQQGFSVDLGEAHNRSRAPLGAASRVLSCRTPPASACPFSIPNPGAWSWSIRPDAMPAARLPAS